MLTMPLSFSQDMTLVDQVLPLSFYLTLMRKPAHFADTISSDHLLVQSSFVPLHKQAS